MTILAAQASTATTRATVGQIAPCGSLRGAQNPIVCARHRDGARDRDRDRGSAARSPDLIQEPGFTPPEVAGDDAAMKATKLQARKPSQSTTKERGQLRIRTGLAAGDVYLHSLRGSDS